MNRDLFETFVALGRRLAKETSATYSLPLVTKILGLIQSQQKFNEPSQSFCFLQRLFEVPFMSSQSAKKTFTVDDPTKILDKTFWKYIRNYLTDFALIV